MGNIFQKKSINVSSVSRDLEEPPCTGWYRKWSANRKGAESLFNSLDKNGDGVIKGSELRVLAETVGIVLGGPNPALCGRLGRRILLRHDADKNKGLGRLEFLRWYNVSLPATHLFHSLDADLSGFLRGPEMRELSRRLQQSDPGSKTFQRLGKRIMKRADSDGDNKLSLDEFITWFSEQ